MANELQNAIKSVADKVAQYVNDAATMTVETRYVPIGAGSGADFGQARPVARTVIKMDGDSDTIIPMRPAKEGQLEADTTLFDLHQRNVNTAIEYRSSILTALLDTLKSRSA